MQSVTRISEREPGVHGQEALQLGSANHLLLGYVAILDGSNEIATLPALVDLLDLKRAVVTIEAPGCQTAITQQFVGQGADDVLALKGNQERLHQDVVEFFEEARATEFAAVEDEAYVRWEAL
jgi:predicted transposase YbfD/YdcC